MSERMTDEQLRKWAEHIRKDGGEVRRLEAEGYALALGIESDSITPAEKVEELFQTIDKLRARVAKLEEALKQIAGTPNAGWMIARAALSETVEA